MTEIAGMSREVFTRNKADINAAIKVILANPKSRKRRRIVEVYEKASGDLLVEVLKTGYGPVVVYRGPMPRAREAPGYEYRGIRQNRHHRFIAPLTGEAEVFHVFGLSRGYRITGAEFINGASMNDQLVFRT